MRTVTVVAGMVALALGPMALAQEQPAQFETPWVDWQPPVVEMPQPNAFALYERAFDLLEGFESPERDGTAEDVAAAVEGREMALRTLQEAIMGECLLPRMESLESTEQGFAFLAKFRNCARFLSAMSRYHMNQGLSGQAGLDCIDGVRMAADAGRGGSLINGLVTVAIEAISTRQLEDLVPSMQAEDCRIAVQALLDANARRVSFAEVTEGESITGRLLMKEKFAYMAADWEANVRAMGATPEQIEQMKQQTGEWQPADSWNAYGRWFAQVIEQARKSYWEREAVPKPGDPLVDLLVPVYDIAGFKFAAGDAYLRLALVHLAGQAYMLDSGAPPENLDQLVPAYLPYIPDDPFRDAPLASAIVDGDFAIYSVGPDLLDNHGFAIEGYARDDSQGDIVVRL